MGRGSNEVVEEQERNAKWYTKECTYCGEKYPVKAEDYDESCYCNDCEMKLYKKDD